MSASSYAGSVPGAIGGFHEEDDEVELELDGADCGATTEYLRTADRKAVPLLAIIAGVGARKAERPFLLDCL